MKIQVWIIAYRNYRNMPRCPYRKKPRRVTHIDECLNTASKRQMDTIHQDSVYTRICLYTHFSGTRFVNHSVAYSNMFHYLQRRLYSCLISWVDTNRHEDYFITDSKSPSKLFSENIPAEVWQLPTVGKAYSERKILCMY